MATKPEASIAELAQRTRDLENLTGFARLSREIYLREPSAADRNGDGEPTATVVLLFWMNAPARPLSKYVSKYVSLAPRARIICITSSSTDFIVRFPHCLQVRRLAPALAVLINALSHGHTGTGTETAELGTASGTGAEAGAGTGTKRPPHRLYIHAWSNGGLFTLRHLATAYRRATGSPLPTHALVIDSAPGRSGLRATYAAFAVGLPKFAPLRAAAAAIVFGCLAVGFAVAALRGRCCGVAGRGTAGVTTAGWANPIDATRTAINDERLLDRRGQRVYIYSDADKIIMARDVEGHAADAEQKGFVVSRRMFKGSAHVDHMRADPARYWRIVGNAMNGMNE